MMGMDYLNFLKQLDFLKKIKIFIRVSEGVLIKSTTGEQPVEDNPNFTCIFVICVCIYYMFYLECSRRAWELGLVDEDITLVCEPNGNYRQLQCQSDLCYCLNSQTGKIEGVVVPESMWTALPCCKFIPQRS